MVNEAIRPERIGLFGGTFDPPHMGHLIVAAHVREELGLDRILFMPAMTPPHKQDREVSPGAVRLAMVERAIDGDEHFSVSDIEVRRGGVSYTIDTVRELLALHPGAALTVLIGMDNLVDFGSWRDPAAILDRAAVAVMTRPGYVPGVAGEAFLPRMTLCEVPHIGIAAQEIRRRVAAGKSVKYLVPGAVELFIHEQGLYR
jgi:nicotinate-nucleotide adenylyltransferase